MSNQSRRRWPLALSAGIILAAAFPLYPIWHHNPQLAGYLQFFTSLPFWGTLIAWIKKGNAALSPSDLDQAANELAGVVQRQWQKEEKKRNLAGARIAVSWDGRREGISQTSDQPEGEDSGESPSIGIALHSLYLSVSDLQSRRRLVIAGAPGAGKTSAAILLLLEAIEQRMTSSSSTPVPILITAHDWNPETECPEDWVVRKLRSTYGFPSRTDTAYNLLSRGNITVIVDGLDEISPYLRTAALRELSNATFGFILLSREEELTDATRDQSLQVARTVTLQPVSPTAAAKYLEWHHDNSTSNSWSQLIKRLKTSPGCALSEALDNPLSLSLAQAAHQGSDPQNLLDYSDKASALPISMAVECIKKYLLDDFLETTYDSPAEGPSRERKALAAIAYHIEKSSDTKNERAATDFNWWEIPDWAPNRAAHIFATTLAGGALSGLAIGLTVVAMAALKGASALAIPTGLNISRVALFGGCIAYGLTFGLLGGFSAGLAVVFAHRSDAKASGTQLFNPLKSFRALDWQKIRTSLTAGLIAALALAIVTGVSTDLVLGPRYGLLAATGNGLVYGLATAMISAVLSVIPRRGGAPRVREAVKFSDVLKPTRAAMALAVGIVIGLMVGFTIVAVYGPRISPLTAVVGGIAYAIPTIFIVGVFASPKTPNARYIDSSLDPVTSQRGNRRYGRTVGLASGLATAVAFGLEGTYLTGPELGVIGGIGSGVVVGIAVGLLNTKSFSVAIASIHLAIRWHTPVRLTRFLNDAYEQHVLRAVGPAYQFRHTSLQDLLAAEGRARAALRKGLPSG